MGTRTDRHDKDNSRFSQFYEGPKNCKSHKRKHFFQGTSWMRSIRLSRHGLVKWWESTNRRTTWNSSGLLVLFR